MLISNIRTADGSLTRIRTTERRISAIGPSLTPEPNESVLDGAGSMALPAAVDMHVHGRVPGGEHKEDYPHLLPAAVAGGIATIGVMPNTSPPLETVDLIDSQVAQAEAACPGFQLLVNVGVSGRNWRELERCLEHPAVRAIKLYESATTGTAALSDDASVDTVLDLAARHDVPVMVHAQDEPRIEANRARLGGGQVAADHSRIQDLECELAAVRRYLELSDRHGARITICHVSSADALELIAEHAHRRGERRVFAEVAPHYWALDRSWLERDDGTLFQMNPALREPEQRTRMERSLVDPDLVDYMATDHAPHTLDEKRRPYGQAPSGIPGVETSLALLWTFGRSHGMTLTRFSELITTRACAIYDLADRQLAPGDRADLILFDPERQWTIRSDQVRSRCAWTPYEGWTVTGRVETTILGGSPVYVASGSAVAAPSPDSTSSSSS